MVRENHCFFNQYISHFQRDIIHHNHIINLDFSHRLHSHNHSVLPSSNSWEGAQQPFFSNHHIVIGLDFFYLLVILRLEAYHNLQQNAKLVFWMIILLFMLVCLILILIYEFHALYFVNRFYVHLIPQLVKAY